MHKEPDHGSWLPRHTVTPNHQTCHLTPLRRESEGEGESERRCHTRWRKGREEATPGRRLPLAGLNRRWLVLADPDWRTLSLLRISITHSSASMRSAQDLS